MTFIASWIAIDPYYFSANYYGYQGMNDLTFLLDGTLWATLYPLYIINFLMGQIRERNRNSRA